MIHVDPAFVRAPALSQLVPVVVGDHEYSAITCQCAVCNMDLEDTAVRAILVREPHRAHLRCLGRCQCGTITLTTLQLTNDGKVFIADGDQWNPVTLHPARRSAIGELIYNVASRIFGKS